MEIHTMWTLFLFDLAFEMSTTTFNFDILAEFPNEIIDYESLWQLSFDVLEPFFYHHWMKKSKWASRFDCAIENHSTLWEG